MMPEMDTNMAGMGMPGGNETEDRYRGFPSDDGMAGIGSGRGFSGDTGPIAMARRPDMNLPVGSAATGGTRIGSIKNDISITVYAAPDTDADGLAQLVGEKVREAQEEQQREAQTYLASARS